MQYHSTVTALLATMFLAGCATQSSNTFQEFRADDLNAQVKAGALVQKTNSFIVLNDSSSSMSKTYLNSAEYSGTKLDVEKNLLNKFNQTIPEIPLQSGMRSFGFGPCVGWSSTHLNQPLQAYSATVFEGAITSLQCSSGGTPLAGALEEAKSDLSAATGNIALIVFSDGMDDASPIPATEALKAEYGDRLCVYTVWVGNEQDERGLANLQQIADLSGCGFSTTASEVSTTSGMSDFVRKVFFHGGGPGDDDQDGVINEKDKCPDTPKGALVDKDGCWAYHGVLFDFDSSRVKSTFRPLLDNAVKVMNLNPELTVEIQGHTDSRGTDAYNKRLSIRRAQAVKDILVKDGVEGNRLSIVGFGESQPVEDNSSAEGRAYNRRVVFKRTDR